MKKQSVAILVDAKGEQTVSVFDKYGEAEAFVRTAKKDGGYKSGHACESRFCFERKDVDEQTEQVADAPKIEQDCPSHEESLVDDFSDIPDGDEEQDVDEQTEPEEQTEQVEQNKPRGRGRPPKAV